MMAGTLGLPFSLWELTIALMVVTIVHEMGHLLAAKSVGISVRRVAVGLGPAVWHRSLENDVQLVLRALPTGMAIGVPGRWTADGKLRRPVEHDLLMASGGPLASFALTLGLLGMAALLHWAPAFQAWLINTAILSTVVALLNLLPLPGLDGGHLLLLGVTKLGLNLQPGQEGRLHRAGLHVLVLICVVLFAVQVTHIL